MAKVTFFEYNTRVLLETENDAILFDSVSQCVNYCNENNIDATVIPA